MKVVAVCTLRSFWDRHPDAEQPLKAWHDEARHANWKTPPPPPLHNPANLEKEATCYCPVCGIGMAAAMERCPHCLEVKTLSCN